jgi:hypothetical protein
MALKKSELYSSLWSGCDELRGGMDASQYKDCNPHTGTVRLNTELAKKPKECLEYIVVHEMVHLLERNHGDRFVALMDRYMPRWQFFRQKLNQIPVRHEDWDY